MLTLQAKTRNVLGKKNKTLRQAGLIPAVVYGHKIKNQNIKLKAQKFNKIFEEAGETSLIDLQVDNQEPVKVIIQDIQKDVLKGSIIHADFHQIREDEELTVDVGLEFVGESPAVEEKGGILVKSLDAIKIQCLPADLIHKIEVTLSVLKDFGDCIYVRNLKIPKKIKVLENSDEAVVSVAAPRTDKELEELEEKPKEGELPEGAEEEKKEGEGEEEGTEKSKPEKKEEKTIKEESQKSDKK